MRNNYLLIWWVRLVDLVRAWRYLLAAGLVAGTVLLGGILLLLGTSSKNVPLLVSENVCGLSGTQAWLQGLAPEELSGLLKASYFQRSSPPNRLTVVDRETGSALTLSTTLDEKLQNRLIKLLHRYHPQLGAGVLLDLDSGAVLALGCYRNPEERGCIIPLTSANLCLCADFPAASLFKMVTAYGILCRRGVGRKSTFPLVGRRHTLYRYQLGLGKSRYRYRPEKVTLEEAFARSVNPVFGKLGIDYFPAPKLLELAAVFGFNRQLEFDLPLAKSVILPPKDDFGRAETACGFISTTRISPLHAALLGGAPLVGKDLKRPYLYQRIIDADGAELYYHQPAPAALQLANAGACRELVAMMRATVRYGTASKSFRHLKRRRIYRQWEIGGKTGSLDMPGCDNRCEWFVGFGRKRSNGRKYAVSVALVHGEKRTISSGYIAAEMLAAALSR